MIHVKHIADSGAAQSDLTGVLAAVAGLVLIGLAAAIPFRHRGEGAAGTRRRWTYRVLAVPVGLLAFLFTVVPIGIALTETHKFREPIGDPPSADYREVAFEASDGVKITGWYRPTDNGATLLVLHGGGGDRTGAVRHAKLLSKHGYGVLLHDARGRGESEGQQNSYGWGWDKDVAGAIAFLKAQPEVDPERIGGLGLLDRRRRPRQRRRRAHGPQGRRRRRDLRRQLRGQRAHQGPHRDDAVLRTRVRRGEADLGLLGRRGHRGLDEAHHLTRPARRGRARRGDGRRGSTTAPRATARSTSGIRRRSPTRRPSARCRPSTSSASRRSSATRWEYADDPVADLLFGVFPVPEADRQEQVIEQVLLADRLGLDLAGIQDHPYQRRYLDTWTLLAYLAGRTERIRLFPDVANLPLRPPALMAKAAASLDRLSGGRFELGLGAGRVLGGDRRVGRAGAQRRRESVDALEEAIGIIRRVWAGERGIRADGEHYRLHGAHGGPQPAHDIGIWLGAYGPRMVRMVGRLADGWIPSLSNLPPDEALRRQDMIDEAARGAGRDPAAIRRLANVKGVITDGEHDGWLRGPADHWAEELTRLHADLRFEGFVFWPDHEDVLGQTERFAEVAARLRG